MIKHSTDRCLFLRPSVTMTNRQILKSFEAFLAIKTSIKKARLTSFNPANINMSVSLSLLRLWLFHFFLSGTIGQSNSVETMKTEETPTEEATFVFSMRPVISSDGGGGRRREDPFGPFYVDEELPPYNRFTLEALKG
jgi:hypothetical protein